MTPTETLTVGNDKISHFIAYAVLMINCGIIYYSNLRVLLFAGILSVAYGMLMEIGQYFVPGRFMSIYDIFANTLGVIIGFILILVLRKTLKKWKINNS